MQIEDCSALAERRVKLAETQFLEKVDQQKAATEAAQKRFQDEYWRLGRDVTSARAELDGTRAQNRKIVELVNILKNAVAERDNAILKMDQNMAQLHEQVNVARVEVIKWKKAFQEACSAGIPQPAMTASPSTAPVAGQAAVRGRDGCDAPLSPSAPGTPRSRAHDARMDAILA